MRIRSIKPEFWRSDDITALPISTRLTFIGLWSYVDDNGVGADKLVSIVADLYADDFSINPQETIQRITEDLQRLSSGGQVIRYRELHNGSMKDLLYISKWKRHQVVNHPSKGHQYPLPPDDLIEAAAQLPTLSRDSQETLTHEQGNRGSEQGSGGAEEPPYPPEPEPEPTPLPTRKTGAEIARTKFTSIQSAPSVNARGIAHAYSKSLPTPIQTRMLGDVAKEIDSCLHAGIPPEAIAAGLEAWTASDSWSPTQIPNFVHKANNRRRNGHGKATEKALGYADAAEQLIAALGVPQ